MSNINEEYTKLIIADAKSAIDSLNSIIACGEDGKLHPSYVEEKIINAKYCVDYIYRLVRNSVDVIVE